MAATSIDGLVLLDKPAGISSFEATRRVGRALGTRRLGHTGTLDPLATGLLVILVGRGTRLIRFVPAAPKVYLAEIAFGEERDTDDAAGVVTAVAELPAPEMVRAAIPALTGRLTQTPPAYSAKKVAGRRAYAMARAGESVELAPTAVEVMEWEVLELEPARLQARITCGSGTYIRALARDLGRLAGTAAHLAALRRERIGPFHVQDAGTNDAVQLLPLAAALAHLPALTLDREDERRVRHGMTCSGEAVAGADADALVCRDVEGAVLAVGRREAGRVQPIVVLSDG